MCEYITATLPVKSDLKIFQPVFERYGFTIDPLDAMAAQRLTSEIYFRPTTASCDCGTILGSAKRARLSPEEQASRLQTEIVGLRKKGWSESKIKRWQAEKDKNSPSQSRAEEGEQWMRLIRAVLQELGAASLGLMVHSYSGSLSAADLPKGKPPHLRLADVNQTTLENMEDGVLYRFVRPSW